MPPVLAVVGAVASIVGTVASVRAQRKAGKAAQQQQEVQTRRSRRQAIREAQIRRAAALASAQGSGAAGSSGVFGGINSQSSRTGEAMGFSTQMSGLSRTISTQNQRAQMWSGIAGIGGNLFSMGTNPNFMPNWGQNGGNNVPQ
jgi:hypothetical protein